jgi:pimeloyl-ACP methyl ester carboxylesterase
LKALNRGGLKLYFRIRNSFIHAIKFGNGKKLLLCFHGFGEDASKFLLLESSLSSRYTVIALDLPFHGETKWERGDLFKKQDLKHLIEEVLRRENYQRFSLMGYSLGGKLVMAAIHSFALQIDEVILAAPDGVVNNSWYNLAVYPGWGQKLFHRFVENPHFVFSIARILGSIRLLDERLIKFLQVQTDSQEKRQKIYDVWLTIKDFERELSLTKKLITAHHIRSFIFIGKYDRVITTRIGSKFSHGLSNCSYIILEKGHNLITESLNEPLRQALES